MNHGLFDSLLILCFVAGITALNPVPGWIPHVGISLACRIGISGSCSYWLPRILKRRVDRDLQLDPEGTLRKMRSPRRWRIIGPILGISLATLGVVTGMIVSGRWTF